MVIFPIPPVICVVEGDEESNCFKIASRFLRIVLKKFVQMSFLLLFPPPYTTNFFFDFSFSSEDFFFDGKFTSHVIVSTL